MTGRYSRDRVEAAFIRAQEPKMKAEAEIRAEIARLEAEAQGARRAYTVAALVAKADALRWALGESDRFGSDDRVYSVSYVDGEGDDQTWPEDEKCATYGECEEFIRTLHVNLAATSEIRNYNTGEVETR